MGVFHDLFQPQRAANLRARLDEYTPAGMDAGIIFASLGGRDERRLHPRHVQPAQALHPRAHAAGARAARRRLERAGCHPAALPASPGGRPHRPARRSSRQLGFRDRGARTPPLVHTDFRIGAGHYYVDGILCEADSTSVPIVGQPGGVVQVPSWTVDGVQFQPDKYVEVSDDVAAPVFPPTLVQIKSPDQARRTLTLQGAPANLSAASAPHLRHVVTYRTQPDYPVPADALLGSAAAGTYQVYVDVWERAITYLEDDNIREVALGGPDTAARAKVVWQVKLTGPVPAGTCLTPRQIETASAPPGARPAEGQGEARLAVERPLHRLTRLALSRGREPALPRGDPSARRRMGSLGPREGNRGHLQVVSGQRVRGLPDCCRWRDHHGNSGEPGTR